MFPLHEDPGLSVTIYVRIYVYGDHEKGELARKGSGGGGES